jgi:hypothetical protein
LWAQAVLSAKCKSANTDQQKYKMHACAMSCLKQTKKKEIGQKVRDDAWDNDLNLTLASSQELRK